MNFDKTATNDDLAGLPSEFRENYRFLTELIDCRKKNLTVTSGLEDLVEEHLVRVRGKLNRRQLKILRDFLCASSVSCEDLLPVPVELEAAIRIKKRSIWLPWEAEAIRKIEKWRDDVVVITKHWTGAFEPLEFNRMRGSGRM
jgi:hypothetical protein